MVPPLAVAIPLAAAATMAALSFLVRRRLVDVAGLLTAAAVTALCALLLFQVRSGRAVYWFSGWHPKKGVALGVSFTVDAVGAGMAAFVAVLMVAALMFSWRYFEDDPQHRFTILMLVFLAALA